MLKTSDVWGLTGNVETPYSRHMTYSTILLGAPTFNSVTSSKLTPTCCERTALHFYRHSEFAFQALSCLLHLSVSCICLSQLLQSSHCFKRAKIIFVHSPASGRMQQSCCSFLQFFTIKDFIEWKPAAGEKKKKHCFALAKFKGLLCLTPFVLLSGWHCHTNLFVSSLFPWKFTLRLSHFNFPQWGFFSSFNV